MTINERIKNLRLQSGLTLKEVADRLGITEGTVQRYESGSIKVIPYESITGLADLFGVNPAYVMGWELRTSDIKELKSISEAEVKIITAFRNSAPDRKESVLLLLGLKE